MSGDDGRTLSPRERRGRVIGGIVDALLSPEGDDAHDAADPFFWAEGGRRERVPEDLREAVRFYSVEVGSSSARGGSAKVVEGAP